VIDKTGHVVSGLELSRKTNNPDGWTVHLSHGRRSGRSRRGSGHFEINSWLRERYQF
jgi:hypothetical protein